MFCLLSHFFDNKSMKDDKSKVQIKVSPSAINGDCFMFSHGKGNRQGNNLSLQQ